MRAQRSVLARPVAVPHEHRGAWVERLVEWWVVGVALLPAPVALK
jgi:hypothetical protein